jgi:hypothetical protein
MKPIAKYLLTPLALMAGLLFAVPGFAQSSCGTVPSLKIWGGITNAQITQYIDEKLNGDWQRYVDHLQKQLDSVQSIHQRDGAVLIHYKGEPMRIYGKNLDTYVAASIKRLTVVSCLADEHAALQAASLADFATAAGGATDEAREVEIPGGQSLSMLQKASVASVGSGMVRLDVTTACENGETVFKVHNRGEDWPKASIFGIYRLGGDNQQVVSSRRMRLKADQTSTFRIDANKNPTGQLGLFVDPSWYKRGFAYDATVRCR